MLVQIRRGTLFTKAVLDVVKPCDLCITLHLSQKIHKNEAKPVLTLPYLGAS